MSNFFCLFYHKLLQRLTSNRSRANDLTERNWFGTIFRDVRKVATPGNIGKVAAIGLALRDDESQLTQRDLEELMERNWFGSIFRDVKKVATKANIEKAAFGVAKKVATPSNIGKVAKFVLREDAKELSQRDLEYLEDLAARQEENIFERDFANSEMEDLD